MSELIDQVTTIGSILPITVVGAIILFILKELIEGFRRRNANARKRRAVRRMIADEIERNNWTIKALRNQLQEIERAVDLKDADLEITVNELGEQYLVLREENGSFSSSPLNEVHDAVISANLSRIAEIDEPIFELTLSALDGLKELDHLTRSIVRHVTDEWENSFLEGFVEYARDEINDCERSLSILYEKITGQKLVEHRVR